MNLITWLSEVWRSRAKPPIGARSRYTMGIMVAQQSLDLTNSIPPCAWIAAYRKRRTFSFYDVWDHLRSCDACNHRIVRLSLEGKVLTTFGRFGDQPGEMRYPYDISISPEGLVLVCEYEGNRLQWFSKEGRSLRTWGCGGRDPGELSAPWGVTYGPNGKVYVVDSLNQRVQIIKP